MKYYNADGTPRESINELMESNNQEPVAYMSESGVCYSKEDVAEMNKETAKRFTIPLYIHSHKELSDEEILDICITGGVYDCINDPYYNKDTNTYSLDADLVKFARAIIRASRGEE